MRIRLIAKVTTEFKTKDGRELSFKTFEDIEGGRKGPIAKSAWRVDQIIAYVGETEVGDIKISYIPAKRFEKVFPTIWHYIGRETGCSISEDAYDDPIKLYKQAIKYFCDWHEWRDIESQVITEEEAKKKLDEWSNSKKIQTELAKFKAFHIDKPLVDFIKVKGVRGYDSEGPNWGRQRIGVALYEYAARWLAERGMVLYMSGLQSDEAKAAWTFMKAHGYPIKEDTNKLYDKPRFYLDYR